MSKYLFKVGELLGRARSEILQFISSIRGSRQKRVYVLVAALLSFAGFLVYAHRAPTADCASVHGFYAPSKGLAQMVDAPVVAVGRQLSRGGEEELTKYVYIDAVLKGHGMKQGETIGLCPFAGLADPTEGQTEAVLLFLSGKDQKMWVPFHGSAGIAPGFSDNTYELVEGFSSKSVSLDEVKKQIEGIRDRRD